MVHTGTPLAWCGVILTLAACGSQTQEAVRPQPQLERPTLTVEIQNHNHNAATIYAYREGFRDRLGFVEAASTETFSFEWPTYELRFLVDFLAQGCVITESLSVDPGDDLLLIIQPMDSDRANQDRCR
jgi:hypothetical protein